MSATDRLAAEQLFHDTQALARASDLRRQPQRLRFTDADYLDHETWIRPAFAELGDLADLDVLDYGCGHGMAAVIMARAGARVTAFDLSRGYLEEVNQRAHANRVQIKLVRANGERLPFASASFDRIWGNAILHHLDVARAARELHRVLREDGRAVFCEPWGENPLLTLARASFPYPGKQRTPDEKPLTRKHLVTLQRVFACVHWRGFQLLSMARRVLGNGRLAAGLDRCDDRLLSRFPALQLYCRYVVVILRR
jgi:SAM-dependent methyltransferase